MQAIFQDLRHCVRLVRRNRLFAATVIGFLGLGIGINIIFFSLVNSVFLKPLPFADADRLLVVAEQSEKEPDARLRVSIPDYLDWSSANPVFDRMGAWSPVSFNIAEGGEPEYVPGQVVSSTLFSTLGVKPLYGRTFEAREDQEGQGLSLVLSHGYWVRRFGADPGIVGRVVALNGVGFTVVGVLPAEFAFFQPADVWVPMGVHGGNLRIWRATHLYHVMGHLKPGVTPQQANSEMDALARRIWNQDTLFTGFGTSSIPLRSYLYGDLGLPLLAVWLAGVLILLIVCVNVGLIVLAHSLGREREFSIRQAIGASRWRLVQQFLTESVFLSLLGGLAGLGLALLSLETVHHVLAPFFPDFQKLTFDQTVWLQTAGLIFLVGVGLGCSPAVRLVKSNLNFHLRQSRGQGQSHGRLISGRNTLIVVEIAVSLVLLAGGVLFSRSLINLIQVDPGIQAENRLVFRINLPPAKYAEDSLKVSLLSRFEADLKKLPGVKAVGMGSNYPFSPTAVMPATSIFIEGRDNRDMNNVPLADTRTINAGYFSALGINLVAGRDLNERDTEGTQPVAIINEMMARRFWPGQNPLGARLRSGDSPNPDAVYTVVGVVEDVKNRGLRNETLQEVYFSYRQRPPRSMAFVVSGHIDPLTFAGTIRSQLAQLDPGLALFEMASLGELVRQSLMVPKLTAWVLGSIAGVAFFLSLIGMFGVITFSVKQRTFEFGLRLALGAHPNQIVGMVVRQGLWLAVFGLVAGTFLASFALRILNPLLFEIETFDVPTLVCISVAIVGLTTLASYLPARHAAAINPLIALRSE